MIVTAAPDGPLVGLTLTTLGGGAVQLMTTSTLLLRALGFAWLVVLQAVSARLM